MSLSPQEKLEALENMGKMPRICPKCGHEMFKTIYGWWKCRNEFCFNAQSSTPKVIK